ncbi:MAG TPA: ABC transporter permease [Galbitalea sp.]
MLAVKRARPRLALFAATFGVVLLLATLAVGLSGFLGGSATAGARAGLGALTGASGGFRITIPLASNAAAQDARVQREIRDTVRSDGQRVPLTITRDVETAASVELDGPRGVIRPALASIPYLSKQAHLVKGAWPTSASEASIQADAAESLGVRVGDRYRLPGGSTVTIVATWRVINAADPIWLGSGLPLAGLGYAGVTGFVVIDPSLWASVGSDADARWTVVPQASRVTSSQLPALQAAPDTVPSALLADKRNGTSVDQDGRLQPAMAPILNNVLAATAVSVAPLVIVALLGVVTLTELARMLAQFRAGESELMRARGATRRRLVLSAALEGAVIAVPAAALGALIAVVLLDLFVRASPVPTIGWAGAVASAVIAIGVLAGAAGLSYPDDSVRQAARGQRVRSTVGVAVVALVLIAAVVAVAQFVQYGSPLTTTASGGVAVDPLAVTAPALALAALSIGSLALFPLVARRAERIGRRRVGLGSLPIQQLARRNRASVTPVLLVALAVGTLVFAATYSGTWQSSSEQTRAVQVGTGVRVTEQSAIPAAETEPVAGQTAAAIAATADVQVGDSVASMEEVPVARIGRVIAAVPGAVDPAALEKALTNPVTLPILPTSTRRVEVHFAASPKSAEPTAVNVTVVDTLGSVVTVDGVPNAAGFTVPLPTGRAPWTIRTIDPTLPAVHEGNTIRLTVSAVGASGGAGTNIPLGRTWTISAEGRDHGGLSTVAAENPEITVSASIDGESLRLQPSPDHGTQLPVVVSSALAQSAGLHVGGFLDLPLVASGGDLPARVVAIVPVIPGLTVDEGVLADLGGVQDAVLRAGLHNNDPTEWWVATSRPSDAARELSRRAPVGAVLLTSETVPADEVLGSANTVVWIAAGAIALLAMLAVAAALLAEIRARLGEVALLRALGVGRRPQARGRVLEIGIMLALGLLAGIVDGVVVSALIVPDLARTAVPSALEALPTALSLDVLAGIGSILAVILIAGALLTATAVAVRRQASLATGGETRR